MVNIERGSKKKPQKIIINDITQVAPDRNRKDVGRFKAAIERAESIHVPNRTQLYDLYHDVITLDGHLNGVLKKRTDAILNKNLHFVDKKKRSVDLMDDLIYSNKFNRLIELIIESKYWGVSGVEFLMGEKFDFEEIPRKHIRPEKGIIVKSQYDYTGFEISGSPFIWTVGQKKDLGQLLQCSMYAIYKRGAIGDFAQYVEIFGQPVRIIYYDAYDTQTKTELRKILNESGGSLAMMIPKQAQFEMLDGKTSNGTGELQERLIKVCNQEMSIAILGNSETTSSSSSSGYAQAEVHSKQQLDITKSDLAFVQNVLNEEKFLTVLRSYGYPINGGSFEFERELDLDALKKRFEIDDRVSTKVPIDDDYWYSTYGVPKPYNYGELKNKREEERKALINQVRKTDEPTESEPPKQEDKENVVIKKQDKNLLARLGNFFFGRVEEINLSDHYAQTCPCCGGAADSMPDLADDWSNIYEEIARKLLGRQIESGTIPESLYKETATQLMAGINQGLGGVAFDFDDKRNLLKSYLTRNVYHFSAAKSLTEMLEYRNAMYDKHTKEVLPFDLFKQRLNDKGKLFNEVYLRTEYDTALQSAIMAQRWDSLNAEYLEFSTVGDDRVRADHAALDGKTYPKDHPFWNKAYPPLAYNCRCTVVPGIGSKFKPEMSNSDERYAGGLVKNTIFDQNVGKTRLVFDKKHPYFVNLPDSAMRELNYKNYGLMSIAEMQEKYILDAAELLSSESDYEAFWNAIRNHDKGAVFSDPLGQKILFSTNDDKKETFKEHLLSRKADKERYKIAPNIEDIITKPDEVWSVYKSADKENTTTHYLKFYENNPMIIVVVDNEAKTMFELNKSGYKTRQGLLLYRAIKKLH